MRIFYFLLKVEKNRFIHIHVMYIILWTPLPLVNFTLELKETS